MTQPTSAVANQPERADPRARLLEAFCSPASAEVFHPIVYQHDIWTADPFDVEEIHAEAREVFQRLLHRAGAEPPPKSGRVLLLKGQSGSGKTHLMRAFRNLTHGGELGYCGYLQMTSQTDNYARYLLSNLIDSLDQPYCLPDVPASGLSRLSLNLLEAVPGITPEDREAFQAGDITDLAERVERYADALLLERRVADPDLLDLVRALLFLQRDDPRVKSRVLKWLRCEDLTPGDRSWLGGLVPCNREEAPQQMIVRLGKLMAARGMPQVLCVDQLEDTYDQEKAAQQFRRAIDTLIAILDAVPTSVVVVSCLEDYFVAQRPHLIGSKLDRLERDPEPIGLTSQRTLEEIEALVARRLQHLYEEQGVPFGGQEPAFPFRREHLQRLVNLRTRDVLDYCRKHHERCVLAGQWVEPDGEVATPGAAEKGAETPTGEVEVLQALEQAWNDFHSSARVEVPDDEGTLAEVLAWAVAQCSEELPPEYHFAAEVVDGRMIPVELHFPGNAVDRLMVALCEKSPRGGGLSRQIGEVEKRAGEIPAVIVRSTDFPAGPKTEVAKQLARIIKGGGRRAVVENAHWRQMLAYRAFREQRRQDPGFASWVRESRPLSQISSLRQILNLDHLPAPRAEAPAPPPPEPPESPAAAPAAAPPAAPAAAGAAEELLAGTRLGLTAGPVTLHPDELCMHAAFLGGTGSGKTTAAVNLIEQLLERGIPAVLVDRKGDLCRYADPAAWDEPTGDAERAERRRRLRDRLDVAVFTPGQPQGRPLSIPVAPPGMDQLPTLEREQLAGFAAAALGGMMGYRPKGADQSRLAILRKAIEVLGSVAGAAATVPALRALLEGPDDALLSAVGGFDPKYYKKLDEDLLTLWLNNRLLLEARGEPLDIDALLGRDGRLPAGKVRLSVISTRFLGDGATLEFWVAQLLAELGRWTGRNPSPHLQAVFLFDEADRYLPAQRQPATKAPMESLLKRARSAGVGVFLATQSPGDFDYKCRDNICAWLVGRIKEQTSLNKLRPMFAASKLDVSAKLPGQETGEFHLLREGQVCALKGRPSLIRTEQVPEEKIIALAAASARGNAAAAAGS